jgi:hypothetical protein
MPEFHIQLHTIFNLGDSLDCIHGLHLEDTFADFPILSQLFRIFNLQLLLQGVMQDCILCGLEPLGSILFDLEAMVPDFILFGLEPLGTPDCILAASRNPICPNLVIFYVVLRPTVNRRSQS